MFEEFSSVSIEKALNSRVSTGGFLLAGHFGKRCNTVLFASEIEFCFWCMDNTPRISRAPLKVEFQGRTARPTESKLQQVFAPFKPLKKGTVAWLDPTPQGYGSIEQTALLAQRGNSQEMIHLAGAIAGFGVCMIGGTMVELVPMIRYFSDSAPENFVKGNLPEPVRNGKSSAVECLRDLPSDTGLGPAALSEDEIGQLLWSGLGCTPHSAMKGYRSGYRGQGKTIPSASAKYPTSLCLLLPSGLYRYLNWDEVAKAPTHGVEPIREGDLIDEVIKTLPRLSRAKCYIVGVSDAASRPSFSIMEAAYSALHISLQAKGLGLASRVTPLGGEEMVRLKELLRIEEIPILISAVGRRFS